MQYKTILWTAPHIITDIIMIRILSMLVMVERWSKNQNQRNQPIDRLKDQASRITIDHRCITQPTIDLTKIQPQQHHLTDPPSDQPNGQLDDQLKDQLKDQLRDPLSDQAIRLIDHREYHQECQFHHIYDQMGRKF